MSQKPVRYDFLHPTGLCISPLTASLIVKKFKHVTPTDALRLLVDENDDDDEMSKKRFGNIFANSIVGRLFGHVGLNIPPIWRVNFSTAAGGLIHIRTKPISSPPSDPIIMWF